MKKRTIIIVIIAIIIITIALLALFLYKNNKSNSQVDTTRIYDQNGQLIADFSNINEVTEIKENISIQGIVEVHHNGYIYIFNGQHFENMVLKWKNILELILMIKIKNA